MQTPNAFSGEWGNGKKCRLHGCIHIFKVHPERASERVGSGWLSDWLLRFLHRISSKECNLMQVDFSTAIVLHGRFIIRWKLWKYVISKNFYMHVVMSIQLAIPNRKQCFGIDVYSMQIIQQAKIKNSRRIRSTSISLCKNGINDMMIRMAFSWIHRV